MASFMTTDDKAMLYRSQALDDRRYAPENQAMLDTGKASTSTAIKAQLASAYAGWKGVDGDRTKKRLAELCAEAVQHARECTPQAVGGWFKTGRIDKFWLPAVSQVLGVQIGVVVELAQDPKGLAGQIGPSSPRAIFLALSGMLLSLDGTGRKQAAAIFEDFAADPSKHTAMADKFAHLLGGSLKSRTNVGRKKAA